MRLLQCIETGEISLTKDLVGNDPIPPYAILSHAWGTNNDEVTFEDITNGTGKDKPGYEKIRFCGEQARQNGLQHCWIDTCCINKSSSAELSEAINSMFRWYKNATRCYVFLTDVTTRGNGEHDRESQLRKSRWFTRGWTLQELIAPRSVEFFSRERERLGDKKSLEQPIQQITGVSIYALRGEPLSRFSVTERMSWAATRTTKREEDMVYSLLGIFDINMPVIYGEGEHNAIRRFREEINKYSHNLQLGQPTNIRLAQSTSIEQQTTLDKHATWIVPFERDLRFTGREPQLAELEGVLFDKDHTAKVAIMGPGGFGEYRTNFSLEWAPRVKTFVDRPAEMAELKRALLPQRQIKRQKIFVLYGLGGIGKTQLAVEFARRHHCKFSSVFWLDGSSKDSLQLSIMRCADRISASQISGASRTYSTNSEGNVEDVVAEVMSWLARPDNTEWLVVFDNVDRDYKPHTSDHLAYDVRQYFSGADQGSVLITTRLARLEQIGEAQQLKTVDKAQAQKILQIWYRKDLGIFICIRKNMDKLELTARRSSRK